MSIKFKTKSFIVENVKKLFFNYHIAQNFGEVKLGELVGLGFW